MKTYIVNQPFMSREGQFEKGKHTLCVGIEVSALRIYAEYRVYIGNNRKDYYDISYGEALGIYKNYKTKALWKRGMQKVFILPLSMFRHGRHEEVAEVKPRTAQLNLI